MTKWQIHLSTAKNNLAHVWQTGLIIQVPENSPVADPCIIIGHIYIYIDPSKDDVDIGCHEYDSNHAVARYWSGVGPDTGVLYDINWIYYRLCGPIHPMRG